MKYTTEAIINLPVARVVELFDNTENLYKWQPELISFEHVSGEPGQPGAQSRLQYRVGKREFEMIETVKVRNLPEEFTGTFEMPGTYNIVKNHFYPAGENQTRYVVEQEFQFKGFMKLYGWFMPGAFKKQSKIYMDRFKAFAESEGMGDEEE